MENGTEPLVTPKSHKSYNVTRNLTLQSHTQLESVDNLDVPVEQPMRSFVVNVQHVLAPKGDKYLNNTVRTCKYSVITFLPLNLLVQFSKMANCYFLMLVLMEFVPAVYTPGGPLSMLTPLLFVVVVSMIKDIIEDRSRYRSDQEENMREACASRRGQNTFQKCNAKDILIGSFVRVEDDQNFPCDLILINSSLPKGIAYIETKGLDGETNLKQKIAKSDLINYADDEACMFESFSGTTITCDMPNADLYKFQGNILMKNGDLIPLSNDQLLLKGCQLRNTGHCYGIAVYTGHQTKVMNNSLKQRPKKSRIELATNWYIILIVIIQFVVCLSAAAYDLIWIQYVGKDIPYLGFLQTPNDTVVNNYIVAFMLWFIALMNFVSISLLVTLEMAKLAQAYFIECDWLLYDIEKDMNAQVQSSNLNEELGMVSYVFSDKTGTLTQNIMEFQRFTAGGVSYGKPNPKPQTYQPGVTNVNFDDERFWLHWRDPKSQNHENLHKFIECLGVCHTVIAEEKTIKGQQAKVYNASSPDELALVNGMRYFGFEFRDRDEQDNILVDFAGQELKYKLLHVLEFSSDRKRMSVVVKCPDGQIMVVCKGADSIINARLQQGQQFVQETNEDLERYAEVGLRTLLVAYRYVDEDFYAKWAIKFKEAESSTQNREKKVGKVAEEMEVNLMLAGCSAIEDKLQENVGQTIKDIKKAGIKVWVLTGDKVETAINIGQSCQLLSKEQNWLALKGDKKQKLKEEICTLISKQNAAARKCAIIVDGMQLSIIQSDEGLQSDFVDLCTHEKAEVVLVCRVSPQQKADVVTMVKLRMPDKSTLAIGDGANDVSMITAAHIGIGIRGLEGQQAARASDYSIGQFQMLKTLLFCHGREAYRRNSYLISYMFYKNVLYVIPILVYGFYSEFSATAIYNLWLYQLYNLSFTSLPIGWFAVFDWEHSKETFLSQPRLYRVGLDDVFFSKWVFWRWFFYAVWQGVLLCLIAFITLDSSSEKYGQMGGLSLEGNFIFAAIVIIANVKVLLSSYQYTIWICLLVFGSIGSFLVVFVLFSEWTFMSTTGEFEHTYGQLQTYITLCFFTLSYILIDNGMQLVGAELRYLDERRRTQLNRIKAKATSKDKTLDKRRYTNYHYSGFAFSQEQGNSKLVTDNLTNRLKDALNHQVFGTFFEPRQTNISLNNE